MDILRLTTQAQPDSPYALASSDRLDLDRVSSGEVGLCRWGRGKRSPESGLRASARHEIAYVIRGRLQISTAEHQHIAQAGDILLSCPTEPHCVVALEDSEVFFVLLNPDERQLIDASD